jgi:hypothetical protein
MLKSGVWQEVILDALGNIKCDPSFVEKAEKAI